MALAKNDTSMPPETMTTSTPSATTVQAAPLRIRSNSEASDRKSGERKATMMT